MPNWCANRAEIHCFEHMKPEIMKLMQGGIYPFYRAATRASIKLFIAGYAGLLQPVKLIQYPPYPDLLRFEIGTNTKENRAFHEWLRCLKRNPELTPKVSEQIVKLYAETGIASRTWKSLTPKQQEAISRLFSKKHLDWFGLPWAEKPTHAHLWQSLDEEPIGTQPFDMRMVMPTRLACEINGFNGALLQSTLSTYDLYCQLYGIKWPIGYRLKVEEYGNRLIMVDFETPWGPPTQKVFKLLSDLYQCRITHYYCEAGCGFCGYGEYELGDLLNQARDALKYSGTNENSYSEVIAPEYILDNVAHFGG